MLTPEQFLQATGWFAIGTLAFGAITVLSFLFKWGVRFRLVGATGFMGVLTAGLFGLSFQPLTQTVIPGAVPYTTVFDSGVAQIVIAVPNSITATELDATLRQAASNLLKPSRIGGAGQATPTIRARGIVHTPGISELVYVGQVTPGVRRSGADSEAEGGAAARSPQVDVYLDQLAKINRAAS